MKQLRTLVYLDWCLALRVRMLLVVINTEFVPPGEMTRNDVAELDLLGEGHLQYDSLGTPPCHQALLRSHNLFQPATIQGLGSAACLLIPLCRLDIGTTLLHNLKTPTLPSALPSEQKNTPHHSSLKIRHFIVDIIWLLLCPIWFVSLQD